MAPSARRNLKVVSAPEDRLPPHSIEAEEGTLGAVLIDEAGEALSEIVAIKLRPEHFFRASHEAIFRAMLALRAEGKPVDLVTLAEELERRGEAGRGCGWDDLAAIADRVAHAANARFHAEIVMQKAAARSIVEHCAGVIDLAYSNTVSAASLYETSSAGWSRIGESLKAAGSGYGGMSDEALGIVRAEDVKPEAISWLWLNRIAKGKFGLIAGEGSDGKSTLVMLIIAAITIGAMFPDGAPPCEPGTCLILAAEDGQGDTLIPRLMAAGAERSRVKIITAKVTTKMRDGRLAVDFKSFQDLDYWRALLVRFGDVRLIVADPIPAYLGRGVNDNHNAEVRSVMEPFLALMEEFGVSLQGISHLGKSADGKSPTHKILGSVAYGNLARIVHLTIRDPEDKGRRMLCQPKNNIAPNQPTLAFRVESAEVLDEGQVIVTSRVAFEEGTVEADAAELFEAAKTPPGRRGPGAKVTAENAAWLFDLLSGQERPVAVGKVLDEAGAAKLIGTRSDKGRWSNITAIYRAKEHIPKLESPREGWRVEETSLRPLGGGKPVAYWQLVGRDAPF